MIGRLCALAVALAIAILVLAFANSAVGLTARITSETISGVHPTGFSRTVQDMGAVEIPRVEARGSIAADLATQRAETRNRRAGEQSRASDSRNDLSPCRPSSGQQMIARALRSRIRMAI
jgi:hypothetical protein